jgi:hypothetical protein
MTDDVHSPVLKAREKWLVISPDTEESREEPEVQRKAAAFNRWHEPDDARVSSPDL